MEHRTEIISVQLDDGTSVKIRSLHLTRLSRKLFNPRWCKQLIRIVALISLFIHGPVWGLDFDFYHGTDYEHARMIFQSRLTPQFLSQMGMQSGSGAPWDDYTDFGKGFYTHVPGQYELAQQWAERRAIEEGCQSGQQQARWGIVIFSVDPGLLRPIDVDRRNRALYFGSKSHRPVNAPPTSPINPTPLSWLEFVEVNRRVGRHRNDPGPMRPGDYDWSGMYAWIQGPIWVPRDSGYDVGGDPIDERIKQRNWLAEGLNLVINNPRTVRQLVDGYVSCPSAQRETRGYGVFLAKNDILVGIRSELEAIPSCRLAGWGRDCNRTVGQVAQLRQIAGPFSSKEEATRWYCSNIIKDTYFRPPLASFLQGAKFRFDGKNHMITNAPGCR